MADALYEGKKKRNRFKQTQTLEQRLAQDTATLRDQLKLLPAGHVRNHVLRRIEQNEAASQMSKWLAPRQDEQV